MLKAFSIGNVTKDAELKRNPRTGRPYCVMRVACDRRYRAPDGSPITDFVSVKARDELAELCADRVRKGDKISVVGDFETVVVGTDPASQPGVLIKASMVEFLTPRREEAAALSVLNGDFFGEAAA